MEVQTTPARGETASVLPRAAYLDPAWFEAEQTLLFARSWLFAGLARELAADGDYLTVEAGPVPLLVVRTGGGLRAFRNICRHRGARLLEGRGNAKVITCPYHRWCYGRDGRLRGIPDANRFPAGTRELGLVEARVANWNGMLFVNADEGAESFEAWLGSAAGTLWRWPVEALVEVQRDARDVGANWKLFVENHIDGYHLAHLHRDSLRGLDHARQSWRSAGRHWLFFEPPLDAAGPPAVESRWLPRIAGLDAGQAGSTVWHLFPAFAGAAGATYFAVLNIVPLAPDRTRIERRVLTAQASAGRLIAAAAEEWWGRRRGDVFAEDARAVEAVQRALRAPGWREGPLADGFETAIRRFREAVAKGLA